MKTPIVITDADRLTLEAAKGLIRQMDAKGYQKAIWEMFEGWIGSDLTDCANGGDRATVWFACRWMHEFFEQIKEIS